MNILQLLSSRDPNMVYQEMMRTNPQFKEFVEKNKGKSVEEIAKENGIDPSVLNLFK